VAAVQRYDEGTRQLRARIGEPFVIELRVHATAGYSWELTRLPEVVRLNHARIRPAGTAIGGSATQEFEFLATAAGEDTLVLTCRRPWEATVIEQLTVKVVIEP
jgi:predicted secreted protein